MGNTDRGLLRLLFLFLVLPGFWIGCTRERELSQDGGVDLQPPDLLTHRVLRAPSLEGSTSITWDKESGSFYAVNPGGRIGERDGKGFVVKIGTSGPPPTMLGPIDGEWVSGLDTPLGITSHGGQLYIADLDQLVVVSIATKMVTRIPIPGARLLSSVAISAAGADPIVFLGDGIAQSVFQYDKGGTRLLLGGDDLRAVNGLSFVPAQGATERSILWVSAYGSWTDPNLAGQVRGLDVQGEVLLSSALLPMPVQPGGILFKPGSPARLYLTDMTRGTLLSADLKAQEVRFQSLRDLRYDGLSLAAGMALDPESGNLAILDKKGAVYLLFG